MKIFDFGSLKKSNRATINNDRESLRLANLDNLITALIICKENYEYLAAVTVLPTLRANYMQYAADRANFAATLYINMSQYGELSVDENGNVLGEKNMEWRRAWFDNEVDDEDILLRCAIVKDLEAVKKYDIYLRDHIPVIKHLNLIVIQQDNIKQVVKKLS